MGRCSFIGPWMLKEVFSFGGDVAGLGPPDGLERPRGRKSQGQVGAIRPSAQPASRSSVYAFKAEFDRRVAHPFEGWPTFRETDGAPAAEGFYARPGGRAWWEPTLPQKARKDGASTFRGSQNSE